MAKREIKTQNVENIEETKVEQVAPVVEEKKEEKSSVSIGIVVDCAKLNIRKAPKKESEIVAIVDAGAELKVIDEDKHAGDWYKVITDNKVSGFCMKKYVKIN